MIAKLQMQFKIVFLKKIDNLYDFNPFLYALSRTP